AGADDERAQTEHAFQQIEVATAHTREPIFLRATGFATRTKKSCRADRHECRCEQTARDDGEDDSFRHWREQKFADACYEHDREKDHAQSDRDDSKRPHYFARTGMRGVELRGAFM